MKKQACIVFVLWIPKWFKITTISFAGWDITSHSMKLKLCIFFVYFSIWHPTKHAEAGLICVSPINPEMI